MCVNSNDIFKINNHSRNLHERISEHNPEEKSNFEPDNVKSNLKYFQKVTSLGNQYLIFNVSQNTLDLHWVLAGVICCLF